jgi:transcriptional regulator with XRE-family HTH domain
MKITYVGVSMNTQITAQNLRAKILGVLIKNARLASGKDLDECARLIHISKTDFEECEMGVKSLSLPELEVLASFLDIPLDHFWGRELLSTQISPSPDNNIENLLKIRTKIIATLLRMGRQEAGYSVEELAERVGLSTDQFKSYESGEVAIPLPVLEMIATLLGESINRFQDKDGPLSEWNNLRQKTMSFKELPPELQTFVSQPINRPYIELAQRISEMPAGKLRTIAENLLEITL